MSALKFKIVASSLDSTMTTNLTDVASDFESNIKIVSNNKEADAKSLINVMALGITQGEIIEVVAIGSDALYALEKIKEFIISNNIAEIVG